MSVMNSSKTLSCFSDSIGFSSIYTACLGYVKIMVLSIFLSESNSGLSSFISKQVRYDQLFIMISWAVRWLTGVGLEWGRPRLWGAGLETCNEMEKCETEERSGKKHIATLCSRKRSKVKLPPFCWTVGQQIFFFFCIFLNGIFYVFWLLSEYCKLQNCQHTFLRGKEHSHAGGSAYIGSAEWAIPLIPQGRSLS